MQIKSKKGTESPNIDYSASRKLKTCKMKLERLKSTENKL
jgi:hypothetical protein